MAASSRGLLRVIEYRPPTQSQLEHICGVDAKLSHFAALVEIATKCLAAAAGCFKVLRAQSRAVCALVIVSRVVKVFDEIDKQGLLGIEVARGLGKIRSINVGDEAEGQVPVGCNAAMPRMPSQAPGQTHRCRY